MVFSEYMNFKEYHIRGVGTSKNLGEGGILKTQFKGKNQNKLMIKVTQEPELRPKIRLNFVCQYFNMQNETP